MSGQLAWFLCQGVGVLVVALVLGFCLRRKTSECLRRFWCGVWLALSLLPLATLVLPKWSVRAPVVSEFTAPHVLQMEPLPATAEVPLPSFDDSLETAIIPQRSLSQTLVQVWAMVACLLLLRLIISQMLLLRFRRSSKAAPLNWQESLSVLSATPLWQHRW